MANTFLIRGEREVRLPYYMLGNALATLRARLPAEDPARRLADPWLAHIEEDMGHVLMDKSLLEDREGVGRLREVLDELADELALGKVPFPPETIRTMGEVDYNVKFTLDTCRRLVLFLDEVIADQKAEAAGSKRSP